MTTVTQGNAAEAAVLHTLARAGFGVLLPFGNGSPLDLAAVLDDGRIVRLQVKAGRVRAGCVQFNSASTDHGHGQRDYRGRVDMIAVSVPELDAVYMVPVDDCPISRGYLRLDAAKNNQRRRVRQAEDYEFDVWARSMRTTPRTRAGQAA